MFDKLLAGDEDPVCEELIALFEDIAATYAEIHVALRDLADGERSQGERRAMQFAGVSGKASSSRSQGLASPKTSQSQS